MVYGAGLRVKPGAEGLRGEDERAMFGDGGVGEGGERGGGQERVAVALERLPPHHRRHHLQR